MFSTIKPNKKHTARSCTGVADSTAIQRTSLENIGSGYPATTSLLSCCGLSPNSAWTSCKAQCQAGLLTYPMSTHAFPERCSR